MDFLNEIRIDTPYGEKSIGVSCMDICHLDTPIDVMTVSAFYGSYQPTPGTLMRGFFDCGIDVGSLSVSPYIDLRSVGNIWLSQETEGAMIPIKRIGCIEMSRFNHQRDDWMHKEKDIVSSIQSYFRMLDIASISGVSIETLGLPILGGGSQNISTELVTVPLLNECLRYLGQNGAIKKIYIITKNAKQAYGFAKALDASYSIVRRESSKKATDAESERPLAFISYSSKDKNIADNLCAKLEASGIRGWYAPRDINTSDYASAIVDGISRSSHFIVIISKNSLESHHVLNEIDLAFQEMHRKIRFYPLRVDEETLGPAFKYYLSRQHWMDAHIPPIEARIDEFVAKIVSEL